MKNRHRPEIVQPEREYRRRERERDRKKLMQNRKAHSNGGQARNKMNASILFKCMKTKPD